MNSTSADAVVKTNLAQRWTWLHTWSGLFLGWVVFALFLTGTISVFWMEITHWAQPELHATQLLSKEALTQYSVDYLQKAAPDSKRWYVYMDDYARNPLLVLNWLDKNDANQFVRLVPDGSGRQVTTETQGGRFFVDFHWTFNKPFPDQSGKNFQWPLMLSGAAGLAFLIGCLSGVIVHRKIFQNFFTFRPKAKSSQQRWLDAHNVLGVLPWPFHVMIIVTGLVYFCYLYIPSGMQTIAGMPNVSAPASGGGGPGPVSFAGRYNKDVTGQVVKNLPPPGNKAANFPISELYMRAEAGIGDVASIMVTNPNRDNAIVKFTGGRTQAVTFSTASISFDGVTGNKIEPGPGGATAYQKFFNVNAGLHFAFFGGQAMRLLYFLCGAAGTAMIACGLLLFTAKRRTKAHSAAAAQFYDMVDHLNVAAIAGSMFASIAYFWAMRLLPHDLPSDGTGGFFDGVYATIRAMPLDAATRPDWELYVFYIAWGLAAVHALLRAPHKAWVEQLSATAALCIGLPVIGYMVPNSGLFAMIAAGDWKTASVDLSSLAIGAGLAWAAWKISGKRFANLLGTPAYSPAE